MNDINLKQIIEQFPDCVTNGAKLKAILLDTYPQISKAIVNTLVIMANSGIAKEIQDSKNITELDKSRWQQKLEDEGFSEKVICSCLNMVFIAFGLNGACISNDEKLVVESSVSIQTKRALPPSNLSDFEIKNGVLVKYKGNSSVVVIPDGVTAIEENAFESCDNITNIRISSSVTDIDEFAFQDCTSLKTIGVDYGNMRYESFDGVLYNRGRTSIEFVPYGVNSVTIPDGVVDIKEFTFSGCENLTCVTIPSSIKSIEDSAFDDCKNIKHIYISDLTAWCNISGLENLMEGDVSNFIDGDVSKILYLNREVLDNIVLPNDITSINYAFVGCSNIESVDIPKGVTSMSHAFFGCINLVSVNIPSSVTSIGSSAFQNCSKLTNITIPDGVTSIGAFAFSGCSGLKSIVIPKNATSIGAFAFSGCSEITCLLIPDGVTSIQQSMFSDCTRLTNVFIPSSVKQIGAMVFTGCAQLSFLKYAGTKLQWGSIEKNKFWNMDAAITEVRCIDGVVRV